MIDPMFPAFETFIDSVPELKNPKGALFKKIPRILGKGNTRARNFEAPPSVWERQLELTKLQLPAELHYPESVLSEVAAARDAIDVTQKTLQSAEGRRRFAAKVIQDLPIPEEKKGFKDNRWFAGHFILTHSGDGLSWSWGITEHHDVIADLPPEHDYIVKAHAHAISVVQECILPPEEFARKLQLAVAIARHISGSKGTDVPLSDVARVFKVACQADRFWNSPSRTNFRDVPDCAFVANFIASASEELNKKFEFVAATLDQAKRALFLPANSEGTQVRPFIAVRAR